MGWQDQIGFPILSVITYLPLAGVLLILILHGLRRPLAKLGAVSIARASLVEPGPDGWYADLSPVAGPLLGPFALRAEALAAEVKWLLDAGTPIPAGGK